MEGVPEVVAPDRRRPLFYVEAQKGVRALADVSRMIDFKKKAAAKQLVFGEVYVPNEKDTDGNWMTADTIEKMAHAFLHEARMQQIDRNHTGARDKGEVVESFIARKGDPDFTEGAWVVGVHVTDNDVWEQIEKGELTGFSIEGTGTLIPENEPDKEGEKDNGEA